MSRRQDDHPTAGRCGGEGGDDLVVLVHGALQNSMCWTRHLPVFERAGCRCLPVDLPGHGFGRAVPWVSLDESAAAVLHAIDSASGRVHLVGFSLGADTVLRVLAAQPDRFATAVVAGAVTVASPRWERPFERLTTPFVCSALGHAVVGAQMGLTRSERARFRRESGPMRWGDYRRLSDEILAGTPTDGLDSVTTPVLVMAGERESAVVRESVANLGAVVPRSATRVVDGAHHLWPIRRPSSFVAECVRWMDSSRRLD